MRMVQENWFGASTFRVLVLTASRVHLLEQTLKRVVEVGPPDRTNCKVWIDMPKGSDGGHSRKQTIKVARGFARNTPLVDFEVVVMQAHVGTRAMWLSGLSLTPPHVILEDDVFLLPGAFIWYKWSLHVMRNQTTILGSSFQRQTHIAWTDSPIKEIDISYPYLYPLVGSHGFLLSPHHADVFTDQLATRASSKLDIDGLKATEWYHEFKAAHQAGLVPSVMCERSRMA